MASTVGRSRRGSRRNAKLPVGAHGTESDPHDAESFDHSAKQRTCLRRNPTPNSSCYEVKFACVATHLGRNPLNWREMSTPLVAGHLGYEVAMTVMEQQPRLRRSFTEYPYFWRVAG